MQTYLLNQFKGGFTLIFLLLTQLAFSQGGGQNNMLSRILNSDYQGKDSQALTNVKGTPFLNDNWRKAFLYLPTGGRVFVEKIKLNGYTGELHYIDEIGAESAPIEGSVSRVDLLDQKDTSIVTNRFNAFVDQTNKNRILFFEVHNNGPVQIVSRVEKFIFTGNYDPLKGKTEQYFKVNTLYAIAYAGKLNPINELGYANVMNAMPKIDNNSTMNKKYKLRTLGDVVAFLNEFNKQ